MRGMARQAGTWCRSSVRVVGRSPAMLLMLLVVTAGTGAGYVFQPFNFGEAQSDFLLSVGWALRVLAVVVVALALSVQVFRTHEEDGIIGVALARGIAPGVLVVGQVMAVGLFVGAVAVLSGLVVAVISATEGGGLSGGWLVSVIMLITMGLLVALVVLAVVILSRATGFLIVASVGIIWVGFLRPVAFDVGGAAAWLVVLAPDFAWLGEFRWSTGDYSGGRVLRALASSGVYMLVLGWIASRGMGRRDQ